MTPSPLALFDAHAHYDDSRFDNPDGDTPERFALLDKLFSTGEVSYIANIGTNLETSAASLELAGRYENIYAACGIHPSDCMRYDDIAGTLDALRSLLSNPKCRAIGEIGLDYHYDDTPSDIQMKWFDAQLALAEETGYPVVVHDREAHGDCMDAVRRHRGARGVFHSYSGSAETARELVSLGWYISFTGVITFKNASRIAEVVKSVPDDRIMIETDCPYLAPVPMRGRENHSGYLRYTAETAAGLRGQTIEVLARLTRENALRFYRITPQEM
ncbi:MAG: TatD family hydrolase [Eubacteriales bacterium]